MIDEIVDGLSDKLIDGLIIFSIAGGGVWGQQGQCCEQEDLRGFEETGATVNEHQGRA